MEEINEMKKKQDLPVGKHNHIDDSKFDAKQLKLGIQVEMEHTHNKEIAKAIVKDHLSEIPNYYTLLKIMEDTYKESVSKGKSKTEKIYKSVIDKLKGSEKEN